MRRLGVSIFVLALVVGAGFAGAGDEAPPPSLDMSHWVQVKSGDVMAFENAVKDHWALHAKAGDPWTWEVWQKVVGEGGGIYSIRTGNHSWADFDNAVNFEGDREHVLSALAPLTDHVSTDITKWDLSISRWPEGDATPNMVEVTEFHLKYGAWREFYNAIKKVHKVIVDKDLDMHYAWGWTVNGGSGPAIALVVPHDSWADFEDNVPDFWGIMEDNLGRTEVQDIRQTFDESLSGSENGIYVFREDLSYKPDMGE